MTYYIVEKNGIYRIMLRWGKMYGSLETNNVPWETPKYEDAELQVQQLLSKNYDGFIGWRVISSFTNRK